MIARFIGGPWDGRVEEREDAREIVVLVAPPLPSVPYTAPKAVWLTHVTYVRVGGAIGWSSHIERDAQRLTYFAPVNLCKRGPNGYELAAPDPRSQ
ncbi:MAG TPA: hypothetical protein VNM34_14960 [Verrucomicrobiae bacterium]|nr:hypothetical protein [Verrucomicrobiae bacterium]